MMDVVPAGAVVLDLDSATPIGQDAIDALGSACARAEDAGAGAVLLARLSGVPGDHAAWPGDAGIHAVNRWERAVRRLERLGAPTVAVVSGECSGIALDVLLATDVRIAEPGSSLRVPGSAAGTWPGMALYRLANQVSAARIRGLALFGGELAAARAVDLGLLDLITADPAAAVRDTLARVAAAPGAELAIRRRLILDATTTSYEDAVGAHLAACDRSLRATAGPVPAAS